MGSRSYRDIFRVIRGLRFRDITPENPSKDKENGNSRRIHVET